MKSFKEIYEQMTAAGATTPAATPATTPMAQGKPVAPGTPNPQQRKQQQDQIRSQLTAKQELIRQTQKEIADLQKQLTTLSSPTGTI